MKKHAFIHFMTLILVLHLNAQDQMLEDIGTALRASSAKEMVKHLGTSVKIQIGGKTETMNKSQAEVALRKFFNENAAEEFSFTHRGSSANGLIYQIGKYTVQEGSYRVYLLLKEENEKYFLYTISFSKE
jgi:hypothetical protein